jgi:hypothetical protein
MELAPAVQRLQPAFRPESPGASSRLSDRWVTWQSFTAHTALVRNTDRIHGAQKCYRARLRRFVLQHRDRALDVVSSSAEMEAEVGHNTMPLLQWMCVHSAALWLWAANPSPDL